MWIFVRWKVVKIIIRKVSITFWNVTKTIRVREVSCVLIINSASKHVNLCLRSPSFSFIHMKINMTGSDNEMPEEVPEVSDAVFAKMVEVNWIILSSLFSWDFKTFHLGSWKTTAWQNCRIAPAGLGRTKGSLGPGEGGHLPRSRRQSPSGSRQGWRAARPPQEGDAKKPKMEAWQL